MDLIDDSAHWRARAIEAERVRDALIGMAVSYYGGGCQSPHDWRLETAVTGTEYFPTREEAVARLLEVCGARD